MMSSLVHSAYFLEMELGPEDRDGGTFSINKKMQLLLSALHETLPIDIFLLNICVSCVASQIRSGPTGTQDNLPTGMIHCICTA